MSVSEFKAKCLAILDHVAATREVVAILKRGRPVAQLVPPVCRERGYPQDDLEGSVTIKGEVMSPVLPASAWEALDPGAG